MAFSRFLCAYSPLALLIGRFLVRAKSIEQVPLFDPAKDTEAASIPPAPLPFYAVAHRVLTVQGVKDAVAHGANALELDMTTWKDHGGWWGQHDEGYETRGDTAEKLFKTIVEQRQAGKNITFVWLDIKNPNSNCTLDKPELRYCSIAGLQDMARELLQPVGVRVIYEFNWRNVGNTPAYLFIARSLNDYEAVTSYGGVDWILDKFNSYGPPIDRQRVMSYGGEPLSSNFGDCKDDKGTCAEMRRAVESGKFGKVIAWTSTEGQGKYVDELLGVANIDALLYGSDSRNYDDGKDIRAAFNDISQWVSAHPLRRFLAGQDDSPW